MATLAEFFSGLDADDAAYALAYLKHFSNLNNTTTNVAEAIMRAQGVLRVDRDGVVGPQTVKAMRTLPRCGCADGYRLGGVMNRWDQSLATGQGITYAVQRYTTGLSHDDQDDLLEVAFGQWTDICGIKFNRVRRIGDANIVISASASAREEFGQPFGVLAWCELPQGNKFAGQVRLKFDDAEKWASRVETPTDILYLNVACHEIGHGIGLDHDPDTRPAAIALMDPIYAEDISRPMAHYDIPQAIERYGDTENPPTDPPVSDGDLKRVTETLAGTFREQSALLMECAEELEALG